MPGFITDYNSICNPILGAFAAKIIPRDDKSQALANPTKVGLDIQGSSEMIDPVVLRSYGGKETRLRKDEVLFHEGKHAVNYFQMVQGSIKLVTTSPDGKEFIQGIFRGQDSFGEPPLFCGFHYPSTAIALEASTIIKLQKERFFKLLEENFQIHLHFDKVLCERLKYKSMVLSEISSYDPEHRIMSLLKYLKTDSWQQHPGKESSREIHPPYIVPFTRQQIADMSGLRVETVIRTVKKMEEKGHLTVLRRKIAI